jgi:hypothetical protein
MDPVLGGEVVERQQRLLVIGDLGDGLGELPGVADVGPDQADAAGRAVEVPQQRSGDVAVLDGRGGDHDFEQQAESLGGNMAPEVAAVQRPDMHICRPGLPLGRHWSVIKRADALGHPGTEVLARLHRGHSSPARPDQVLTSPPSARGP